MAMQTRCLSFRCRSCGSQHGRAGRWTKPCGTATRRQFGRLLSDDRLVKPRSSPIWLTELDASRLLVYRAAWLKDSGAERVTRAASEAKLFATAAGPHHRPGSADSRRRRPGAGSVVERLYRRRPGAASTREPRDSEVGDPSQLLKE